MYNIPLRNEPALTFKPRRLFYYPAGHPPSIMRTSGKGHLATVAHIAAAQCHTIRQYLC